MTIENPLRKQEGQKDLVETSASQESEQYVAQEIPKYVISPKTQREIDDLAAETKFRASQTNEDINISMAKKDTGGVKLKTPIVKMDTKPTNKWRNFKMATRIAFAGLLGLGAASGAKAESTNPGDSTKNKIEKVSSISKESKEFADVKNCHDWNTYIDWLKSKNLMGDESLDHGGKGMEMLKKFIDENPGTSLSANEEFIKKVQARFSELKDYSINELRNKRAKIIDQTGKERFVEPNENLDWFMRELSIVDGIPGHATTKHKFPESFLVTVENNQVVKKENQGFIKVPNGNSVASSDFAKNNKK